MKTHLALLSCILAASQSLSLAAETPPASSAALYTQGMAAISAGDAVKAEALLTKALQVDPNNANAKFQLMEVRKNSASISAKGREAKFGSVTVAKLQLEGASLQEALDVISKQVGEQSKQQVAANFIIQDEKGAFANKQVSLKLANIPAKAALEYVLTQVGAKARFDEHAIVIIPRGS